MPSSRAYAPVLAKHGISIEKFMQFVGDLNVVVSSSPRIQIIDLAGGIVGLIPIAHAYIISSGISTVAKLGDVAVMKIRGSISMRKANSDLINPRGLNRAEASLSTSMSESAHLRPTERVLASVQRYVEPLTFNVPPQ